MKSGDEIHELNYELINRAIHGKPEALEEILRIYEPYHDSLVTSEVAGAVTFQFPELLCERGLCDSVKAVQQFTEPLDFVKGYIP